MIDSVPAVKKYTWEGKYKRLAFLPGYMTAGNLVLDGTTHKVALKLNAHDQLSSLSVWLTKDLTTS